MKRVNVHIYPAPFRHESRRIKITQTLKEQGIFGAIYILATWEAGLPEVEQLDEVRTVWRIRRAWRDRFSHPLWRVLFRLEWAWRIFWRLRGKRVDCINCHILAALPLSVLLKIVKRARLVYDTHELETEVASLSGIPKRLAKMTERALIRWVDEVIVVNQSIADWYQQEYGVERVTVVRNVPYRNAMPQRTSVLRDALGIAPDELLFIYQGKIGGGRGVEMLLEAFSQLPPDRHLVLMGYGTMVGRVQEYAAAHANIHYHPAVPPQELRCYTVGADIGVHIIENTCLNHYFCLPNKVCEYVGAGLPVIVSDFPEMARLVNHYQCGWLVEPTAESMRRCIASLSREEIDKRRQRALMAASDLGWHQEEPQLRAVYSRLFPETQS